MNRRWMLAGVLVLGAIVVGLARRGTTSSGSRASETTSSALDAPPSAIAPRTGPASREPVRPVAAAREIRGHVVDASGAPVAGARVSAASDRGASPLEFVEASNARSDASGAFETELTDAGDGVAVRVETDEPDAIAERCAIALGGDGAFDAGTLRLEPRLGLRGRVVDEDGRSIEGARVAIVISAGAGCAFVNETRSAADGRFELRCSGKGCDATVEVDHDDFAPGGEHVECGGEPVVVTLHRGVVISGVVRDADGRPIDGASVALDLDLAVIWDAPLRFPFGARRLAKTGPDGAYTLDAVPTGRVHLCAFAPAHEEVDAYVEGPRADFRLTAFDGISGMVVERETGRPIAGASVNWGEAFTGDDGRFVVPKHRARWNEEDVWVEASAPSFAPGSVRVDEGVGEVRLELERAATIRGRVLEADGTPVVGATVELVPDRESPRWPKEPYPNVAGAGTDFDGRFEADDVAPGPYVRWMLLASRHPEQTAAGIEVAPGGVYEWSPRLGGGRGVRGRVVAVETGAAVPLAKIVAWRCENAQWLRICQTSADESGTFAMRDFVAGSVTLCAGGPGRAHGTVEVALPDAEGEVASIEIGLAAGMRLEGVVVDESGAVQAGASIGAKPAAAEPLATFLEGALSTNADGAGRFAFDDLPAAPVHLVVFGSHGSSGTLFGEATFEPPFAPVRVVVKKASGR
jgi:protocatechuate 3,4-dioxygenase beta subunit